MSKPTVLGRPTMRNIPPTSLSHLPTRISYTRDFLEFTSVDAAALHASKPLLTPLIPHIVDVVYTKLLSFSVTAASFVPRQTGYIGPSPTSLNELSLEHPQIKFRKDFLADYIGKLVSMDYADMGSWEYLDKVGRMHTGVTDSGFKHRAKKPALRVEYVHCQLLLGFVEDVLVEEVVKHPDLDLKTKTAVVKAVNKLLWLQNDLFARHYITESEARPRERVRELAMPAACALLTFAVAHCIFVPLWRLRTGYQFFAKVVL